MKILLHICCAPCMIYPLKRLEVSGFRVAGIFYNPNIHPFSEYKNRKQALETFFGKDTTFGAGASFLGQGNIIYPDYEPKEFFRAVNLKEIAPERCAICWKLRLSKTAKTAKEKGMEYFSTTLLVSPYQDQELIKKIGQDVENDSGIKFYYEDFRPGFRKAHDEAKEKGVYCQKYCGCIYSEMERYKNKQAMGMPVACRNL